MIDPTLLSVPDGARDVTVVEAIDGLSYIDPNDPAMPSYRVIANNRQPVALRDMLIEPVRTGYIGANHPKPDPALVPQAAILAGHLYEHERHDGDAHGHPLHHASSASRLQRKYGVLYRHPLTSSPRGGGSFQPAPDRTGSASYAASADSCASAAPPQRDCRPSVRGP